MCRCQNIQRSITLDRICVWASGALSLRAPYAHTKIPSSDSKDNAFLCYITLHLPMISLFPAFANAIIFVTFSIDIVC